jgi:hypothetical protein
MIDSTLVWKKARESKIDLKIVPNRAKAFNRRDFYVKNVAIKILHCFADFASFGNRPVPGIGAN